MTTSPNTEAASKAGANAFLYGEGRSCPHAPGPLCDAWLHGYDMQFQASNTGRIL